MALRKKSSLEREMWDALKDVDSYKEEYREYLAGERQKQRESAVSAPAGQQPLTVLHGDPALASRVSRVASAGGASGARPGGVMVADAGGSLPASLDFIRGERGEASSTSDRSFTKETGAVANPDSWEEKGGVNMYKGEMKFGEKTYRRKLRSDEKTKLEQFFGKIPLLDEVEIDLAGGRPNTIKGKKINLNQDMYLFDNPSMGLRLKNEGLATLAHEIVHVMDREKGRNVTLEAAVPQVMYTLGLDDPYDYGRRNIQDKYQMLEAFNGGTVEQRAQIVYDWVLETLQNKNVDVFDLIKMKIKYSNVPGHP